MWTSTSPTALEGACKHHAAKEHGCLQWTWQWSQIGCQSFAQPCHCCCHCYRDAYWRGDSSLEYNLHHLQIYISFSNEAETVPNSLSIWVTGNKSQGQSLNRIGLYLDRPMFSHGQLYVGLSRVGSPDNTRILLANETSSDSGSACTDNVVYPEIFAP